MPWSSHMEAPKMAALFLGFPKCKANRKNGGCPESKEAHVGDPQWILTNGFLGATWCYTFVVGALWRKLEPVQGPLSSASVPKRTPYSFGPVRLDASFRQCQTTFESATQSAKG